MSRTPTASDIAYMKEHIDDSRSTAMIVTSVICGTIACIAVVLRVIGRRLAQLKLKADDWWMIISLVYRPNVLGCLLVLNNSKVLYLGVVVSFALSTAYGAGRHIILVTNARALAIVSLEPAKENH